MIDQKRLAKLYGVKGLPLPLVSPWLDEDLYWMHRMYQLGGIGMTIEEYYEWWERARPHN